MISVSYFFGIEGRSLQGDYLGWVVKVIDDTQGETGGYYILVGNEPQNSEAYDWWLEKKEEIPIFIRDMNWLIEWPTNDS